MELQKLHPPEDEILNQYLVPAICKAAAVLGMVSESKWRGHWGCRLKSRPPVSEF